MCWRIELQIFLSVSSHAHSVLRVRCLCHVITSLRTGKNAFYRPFIRPRMHHVIIHQNLNYTVRYPALTFLLNNICPQLYKERFFDIKFISAATGKVRLSFSNKCKCHYGILRFCEIFCDFSLLDLSHLCCLCCVKSLFSYLS